MFITFEGIDGSGKTTQIKHFIENLERESIPFLLLREPGGTIIGEKIREILLDKNNSDMLPLTEYLLYSASRHQLTKQRVLPALNEGKVVVCDRYFDSSTAYQGYGRKIDLKFVHKLNTTATIGTLPDLTIVLDIPVSERDSRIESENFDRLEQENRDFQESVREGFLSIAKQSPDRFIVVDGTLLPETVSNIIWNHFKNMNKRH